MLAKGRVVRPLRRHASSNGFSLVEILVVIAIIAVIAALSFPALGKMLQKQREAKSIGNMKAVSAMIMSHVAETGLYPSTTSPTYCNALYSYLAPGQPVPPQNESNEKLAGTVFVSPFMTMELLKKHNFDKSFGGQYVLRQVYGINGRLSQTNGINSRAALLSRPSITCLLMSSPGPRTDTAGNVVDIGAEALDGYLQVLFADGHLEKLPREKVPKTVLPDGTNNYNRLFWIGRE